MSASYTFLIMAGGTGGHIFPALAIAKALQAHDHSVQWLGAQRGMEERIVPGQGIALHSIQIGGVRGKGWKTKLLAPFTVLNALWQALRVLKKTKPDCVVGLGGYVTGPGGLAAWLCRIPLVIHEQNAVAGTTNRILSRMATVVIEAFSGAFARKVSTVVSGNPVRDQIIEAGAARIKRLDADRKRVLIVGGSLGALAINKVVPEALAMFAEDDRPEIWHQTGEHSYADTQAAYGKLELEAKVAPFIDDMAAAYEWADLVICRAGALTVSELCVVGVPAILVPLPHAIDDHQTRNAESMTANGAGLLLKQADMRADTLYQLIIEMLEDDTLKAMSDAARALGKPDATIEVANICIKTAKAGKAHG